MHLSRVNRTCFRFRFNVTPIGAQSPLTYRDNGHPRYAYFPSGSVLKAEPAHYPELQYKDLESVSKLPPHAVACTCRAAVFFDEQDMCKHMCFYRMCVERGWVL